ncbi:MAG: Gfo/Idh/MocA family protein [Chthonomonadales bacterium]
MDRRFLVIGCGSIGRRHMRNLRALRAGVLFAWDPDPTQLGSACEEVSAQAVPSLQAGLEAEPDACFICSPTALHSAQVQMAASYSHLFVEKPLAADAASARDAAAAVRVHHRICLVACNLRFHPGVVALREALEEGQVGHPLIVQAEFGSYLPDWRPWQDYRSSYSARRELGGGILLDAIHELDLVRWLAGELTLVQGFRATTKTLQIDTEEIACLHGRSSSGVCFQIHLDYLQRIYTRRCKVIGTEGTLLWDLSQGQTLLQRPGHDGTVLSDFRGMDLNQMYVHELRHFLDCLDGRCRPAQDADNAAALVEIAESVPWI